jgi:hypothetical protein
MPVDQRTEPLGAAASTRRGPERRRLGRRRVVMTTRVIDAD